MSFLKKIFGFGKEEEPVETGQYIVVTLNDKIQPIDRGTVYEDPLDIVLSNVNLGEVTGGGTLQKKTGEIEYCDIEILINKAEIDSEVIHLLKTQFEKLGAPKGSIIRVEKTEEEFPIGRLEGIGIYLDGQTLPEQVYKENDINTFYQQLNRQMNIKSNADRYWEGGKGTAFYFYGASFVAMKERVSQFVENHPLGKNARVEQIA